MKIPHLRLMLGSKYLYELAAFRKGTLTGSIEWFQDLDL
jgi:hypothetical protein